MLGQAVSSLRSRARHSRSRRHVPGNRLPISGFPLAVPELLTGRAHQATRSDIEESRLLQEALKPGQRAGRRIQGGHEGLPLRGMQSEHPPVGRLLAL